MVNGASRWRLLVGALFVAWLVLSPGTAGAATPDGEVTFQQSCSGCHTIGGGKLVGPDLQGVADRLGADGIAAMIRDPAKARPGTTMPDLNVPEPAIVALVSYLGGDTGGGTPPPPPPPATVAGDAGRGKSLFEGSTRFANEGPPCLSCHTIAGIGALGGGQLGPDLTGAYAKLGPAAAAFIGPTMAPIFTGKPLTKAEQADIAAFLKQASTADRPSDSVWVLLLLGIAGAVLAVLLAFLLWPRRRLVVRRTIVDPPTIREG